MKINNLLVAALACALSACTMAPKYETPASPVNAQFPAGAAYDEVMTTEAKLPAWDVFFTDAKLRDVIAMALENSRDFRVASLSVKKAKAAYGITRSSLFPTVAAAGTESASHTPGTLSTTGSSLVTHTYQANLAASSWELDFFGRVRSLTDAALEEYLATEEGRLSAKNALIAQVATAWVNVGAQKNFLQLAEVTLKSQQETYRLMEANYRLGASSKLELEQAKTTVANARASVASYQRSLAQAKNALNLLVGKEVPAGLEPEKLVPVTNLAAVAPAGLSSSVLLNRPDIRQAENQLKAANANIGAARANFFPRITLTGAVGTGSRDLSDLFSGGTGLWSFTPAVSLPIFTGGANISTLRQAEAQKEIMVAQYEKAIQTAFSEVSNALASEGTMGRQTAALKDLMIATENAYALSQTRYKSGLDGFLTVLESQRQMVSAQTNYIASEQATILSRIQLYQALGGASLDTAAEAAAAGNEETKQTNATL
jgi:multidrug efflux system outer membrane protein